MFHFLVSILKVILMFFKKDIQHIMIEYALIKKENLILKRQFENKIKFKQFDRTFYSLPCKVSKKFRDSISLVQPETVLKWTRKLIKQYWIFKPDKKRPGRPRTPLNIRNLILNMKNDNIMWGAKKIRDELLKVGIDLCKQTIQNIILDFRRKGKIKLSLTWKKFLMSHIKSIFATDMIVVDTILNMRFFIFFIIKHETREIVKFAITQNPTKEFIRQQIIDFTYDLKEKIYLIHDRSGEYFFFNFKDYGIIPVKTCVKAPNMPLGARRVNSIAERFVKSVRREALDWFIIFSRNQLYNIIKEYIEYYNTKRPHQGINGIPQKFTPKKYGKILKIPILSGLHHSYERCAA